ncbi:MAG: hypothetical protein AAFY50_10660 [Cyanobacteria bacterium J06648_1]
MIKKLKIKHGKISKKRCRCRCFPFLVGIPWHLAPIRGLNASPTSAEQNVVTIWLLLLLYFPGKEQKYL